MAGVPGVNAKALEAAKTELSSQVRARLQPGARSFVTSLSHDPAQDSIASGAESASDGTTRSGKRYRQPDYESAESLNSPESSGM